MRRTDGPPESARRLLEWLLSRESADRALADLEDVFARVAAARGVRAARRACLRESAGIVLWSWLDAVGAWFAKGSRQQRRRQPMLMGFGRDVRYALRSLARRPGFTLLTVSVLGIGIGANVAIFTIADRLFLRAPLGVAEPDRLVRVYRSWGSPDVGGSLSYPDYLEYRDGATTLSGLAAYSSSTLSAMARVGDALGQVTVLTATADYFDVLGVSPASGRFFRAEENRTAGTHPVAVVSWSFWRDRLGGTAEAVGRDVLLNGHRFTVIGVAPREFAGLTPTPAPPDVYIPILMRDAVAPSTDAAWRERLPELRDRWLFAVGRLNGQATAAAAQSDLARIATGLREQGHLDPNETVLVTERLRWVPSTRASLAGLTRILLSAVALLLAIAAANVAVLLLARATTRDREVGIRTALGAGRARVTREMLTESLMLGAAGCAVGLGLSVVAARAAAALLPVAGDVPVVPDLRAVAFAVGLSFLTALVVGAVPARRAHRLDVVGLIQGRNAHAGGGRTRDLLVVVQIALSLVLVASAALFARSFTAARAVDLGFDTRGVLLVGVNLRNHGYDEERGRVFVRTALDRLRALPGVTVATTTRQVPFRGDWTTDLEPWEGSGFADGRTQLTTGLNVVGSRYFEGMGIPLVHGRDFADEDRSGGARVVVVNETFARLAFGTDRSVGRTIQRGSTPPLTVVGVVRDATYYTLAEERWPQVYLPFEQFYQPAVRFMIRSQSAPAALANPVRDVLHDIDPDIALTAVETLESVHAEQIARYRASATVVGLTGLIALLLACVGLYGVMAYRVAQRTREIGVRVALGASRREIAAIVLRRSLRLVLPGLIIGLAAALASGRLIESLLFGVPARDPVALVGAPLVLLMVALLATVLPVRRAVRIDPAIAMRTD